MSKNLHLHVFPSNPMQIMDFHSPWGLFMDAARKLGAYTSINVLDKPVMDSVIQAHFSAKAMSSIYPLHIPIDKAEFSQVNMSIFFGVNYGDAQKEIYNKGDHLGNIFSLAIYSSAYTEKFFLQIAQSYLNSDDAYNVWLIDHNGQSQQLSHQLILQLLAGRAA